MGTDPHTRRLRKERTRLINLDKRSDFISIESVDEVAGMPPDKYIITFTCKGIARINDDGTPIASDFHRVSMYISRDFPRREPYLKWLTPIWHPNIQHKEPYRVCINKEQNYNSTTRLNDLVVMLAEMVQYKRYHAIWKRPYPYDKEVADWVLRYAEPRGIVGPDKPFDPRPLERVHRIRRGGGKAAPPPAATEVINTPPPPVKREGMVLGQKRNLPGQQAPAAAPVRKPGLTLGAKRNL
jgi:ubiquitin-protein ligase